RLRTPLQKPNRLRPHRRGGGVCPTHAAPGATVFHLLRDAGNRPHLERLYGGGVGAGDPLRRLYFGGAVGLSREEAEERAKSILEKVGMLDKIDQYPANLSGGQQQRVAIARALVMRPKVMQFDEPTSALDPETVGEVLGVIKEIAKEGEMAMMLMTHEMSFAREVAGRVVFFDEGRIVEQGPPEKIFENPENDRLRDFLRRFNMLFNGKNGASV